MREETPTYGEIREAIAVARARAFLAAQYSVKADHWEATGDKDSAKVAREWAQDFRRESEEAYDNALSMLSDVMDLVEEE